MLAHSQLMAVPTASPALVLSAAALALAGLIAYAVLGGADFGGGVWDLFARGPRRQKQRDAIAHAMGPVWEANHVWIIFVLVLLFTCFPYGYGPMCQALFIPLHLALVGIVLRGAAFAFRGHSARKGVSRWSVVFGAASLLTPLLLGAAFGAITGGGIRVGPDGTVNTGGEIPWLKPYSIGCGLLALSACAYLAAVYLTVETEGELREDFRRRAIIAGTATAGLALVVLVLAWFGARWFFDRLMSARSAPIMLAGLACFAGSAWAVFRRRYALSRWCAAAEIALLLIGWGLAQQPYLIYPDLRLKQTSAPPPTIEFMLATLPVAGLAVAGAMGLLFAVFKRPHKVAGL